MFTGHNPGDILGEADVDGGATVLTSPPFDPGDATSLSVSLARFFHRSDLVPTGLRLEVALLVPDEDAPEGVAVHVLEALDGGPEAEPANSWEVVTFPACGVDLRPGTRLRITASDLSSPDAEIVEAAIDQVRVEGYPDMDVCAPGLGALCDPDDPDPACGSELLCCAEGPIFQGTYRCAAAERAIGDTPPAAPGEPFSGELGCPAPDLELRDDINVYTQNIWVAPDACTLYEACVGGSGWRRILSFDTKAANVGAADLVMGIPANHLDLYTYSACHEHYHFDDYASYELLAGDELVASGHKQAYCLLDFESWAWPELTPDDADFSCVNQGISVGWSDTYQAGLDCQWIDITDVDPGEYTLHVEVNLPPPDKAHPMLVERRYDNNVLDMQVIID
ncbi:hypothetical protein G6O69_23425 [Pseudenhygromyxa sp. WMMC2535]|nr:hypothetical protein [Pseudenhygromyxa sp. WMMC2535]